MTTETGKRDLPDLLHLPVEALINRGIGQSTTAQALARELEGKSLDARVDGSPFALRITLTGGRARVHPPGGEPAGATVSGALIPMVRLLGGDPEGLIRDGEVRISGDGDLAERFRELLKLARPDLEEELSKLVGDAAAHQAGNLVRNLVDWGRRARASVGRSVGEYFTEERKDLPPPTEVAEFHAAVDTLASDVDRAEARLRRLQAGRAPEHHDPS
jgi:ubiquinone biosynthesis protein UbiJ